jgi:hypothetical protein
MARGLIDEGHADLDEPLNNKLHIVATRQKGPLTRSPATTLRKRPF